MLIVKVCIAILLLLPVISFYLIVDIKTTIYATLISILFPIHIQLMGLEVLTTGTVCIFLLFIRYFMISIFEKQFIREKYDYWIYLLIILGMLSVIVPYHTGSLEKEQFGPSLKLYLYFISSLLFFIVIKNVSTIQSQSHFESNHIWLQKLLNVIIFLVSIHIVISVCVNFYPPLGSFFKIFLSKNGGAFDLVSRREIERIGSFVFGPEAFGEILATLSPLVIYKFYRSKNPIWLCCLLVFSVGVLFTVTRSGILLFITGTMISIFYMSYEKINKSMLLIYVMLSGLVVFFFVTPSVMNDLILRFESATTVYNSGGSIFEILNRNKFPDTMNLVLLNISVFGNGVTDYNYHNLFLTTIHRRGIVGGALFFSVILYPLVCLIQSYRTNDTNQNNSLIILSLLAMMLFFINELKYEFTRGGSYQQLCWALFATLYLVSKTQEFKSIDIQRLQL